MALSPSSTFKNALPPAFLHLEKCLPPPPNMWSYHIQVQLLDPSDKSLKDNFVFDEKDQKVTVNYQNGKYSALEPYTGPGGVFDGSKFYYDYIKTVFAILQNYEIPDDCPLRSQTSI